MSHYFFTVRGKDDADALAKVTEKVDAAIAGTAGFPAMPEHAATREPVLAAVAAFLAVVPDEPGCDICVDVGCSLEPRAFATEQPHTGANIQVRAHLALRENP
jgi:hypothetical protein